MSKDTICLNMIVKNESHIIRDTLQMLLSKINFDYWVICDTGSTDNTPQIITDFFKHNNIDGELHLDQWVNFAVNRTKALEYAFNKTDYLFIFDADDNILGDIIIPKFDINIDGYSLFFGHDINKLSYKRTLLVNNRIHWKYMSVLHEFICCLKDEPNIINLEGNYCIISGRTGARNKDPFKYLDDALLLENAWMEAKKSGDTLYLRYAFYCANSYKDYGLWEEAIKWYKITLSQPNWEQEKYMSCYYLFKCYKELQQIESGIYYLIESFKYDNERAETIYYLVEHYSHNDMSLIAYNTYLNFKPFYEGTYMNSTQIIDKLFVENAIYDLLLPYYLIIVCHKIKDKVSDALLTGINMFKLVFTKRYELNDTYIISNLLYNFQFYYETICQLKLEHEFVSLLQSYLHFLKTKLNYNFNNEKYHFLISYEKFGLNLTNIINLPNFSKKQCKESKNILIYTGYMYNLWNYTYSLNNGLGGSETAAINLAINLPKDYNIFISGYVKEEIIENIQFISIDNLYNLLNNIPFHTIIVSRYINFYEKYTNASYYRSLIWAHDLDLISYECSLSINDLLQKYENKFDCVICQTPWHQRLFQNKYPILLTKLTNINNAICIEKFTYKPYKILNRFVYSSCTERGLQRLLKIWPNISNNLLNAELFICSYNNFPRNDLEVALQIQINSFNNVKHLGKLTKNELYELMSSAEYWLYPTHFEETSCITAMEMLMSEVICIYYPIGGLINTIGSYGIPVTEGEEVSTLLRLTNKDKLMLRKNGYEYASTICSWQNKIKEWNNILFN